MKVTVRFGDVRVVVPCEENDLISDLIEKAIYRYKKANYKNHDRPIIVRCLQTTDEAILDNDDMVKDVVDDKDQITAVFEEGDFALGGVYHSKRSSAASSASSSSVHNSLASSPVMQRAAKTGLIITAADDLNSNCILKIGQNEEVNYDITNEFDNVAENNRRLQNGSTVSENSVQTPGKTKKRADFEQTAEVNGRFARDSARKSLGNGLLMTKWLDAQEKVLDQYENLNNCPAARHNINGDVQDAVDCSSPSCASYCTCSMPLRSEFSSIKLHHSADPSASHHSPHPPPRHQARKRILPDVPLVTDAIPTFTVTSFSGDDPVTTFIYDSPPGMHPTSPGMSSFVGQLTNSESVEVGMDETTNKMHSDKTTMQSNARNLALSPSKNGVLAPTNTRIIGRKLKVQLKKGEHGLGFSITTRDNLAGGDCPIYIKNILPKGAAVEDGRLKLFDRLLEVNGIEMTGKTQLEAVAVLRNIEVNSVVDIIVSRQTDEEENPESTEALPISSPPPAGVVTNNDIATNVKEAAKSVTLENPHRAPPPFDDKQEVTVIAHLSDINSPKYGMTLKPISMHGSDLGLFIHKSTSKENKFPLPNNARLVEVDGTSLLGISNSKALHFVTKAMKKDAANPGSISVKISGDGIPSPATTESFGNSNTLRPISCVDGKMYTMNETGNLGKVGKYEQGDDYLHSSPSDAHKEPNQTLHPLNGSQCIESVITVGCKLKQSENLDPIDATDECAEDLDVTPVVFNREGFGRQSMSEKRKGHIDPRGTDVYQKIRMNKDFSYASWDPRKSTFHKSEGSKHSDLFRSVAAKKYRSLENLHADENGEQVAPLDELSDIAKDPFNGNVVTSDASSFELETVDEQFAEYDNNDGRVGGGYEITDVTVKNVNESRKSERKKSDHDSLVGLIKKSIDRIKFGKPKKIYDLKMQQKIPAENTNESESDRRRVGKTWSVDNTTSRNSYEYPSQESGNLSNISHEFLTKVCSENRVNAKDDRNSQFTLPGKFLMNKKSGEQIEQLRRDYQQQHEDRKKRYPVDDMEERRIQEYERQRSRLSNQDAPQPSVQRVGQYSSAEQELVEFCESANSGYSQGKSRPRTANAVPYRQCQNANSRERFFDSTVYFDGANYHTSSLPNRNSKKRSSKDQLLPDPYVAPAASNYHEVLRSKRDYQTSKSVFYRQLPTGVEHGRQTSAPLVSENSNRAGPDEMRRKSHSGIQPVYVCNYQGQYRTPQNELRNRFEGLISRSAQV